MEWIKRPSEFSSFAEQEEKIFADFTGARTDSYKYKIKNIEKAVSVITEYLKAGKTVKIIGDYDADGVTSTSELILILKDLKKSYGSRSRIGYYIPKRFTDGYGMSQDIVKNFLLCENTPGLLITVDNGIAAIDAVKTAKEAGWAVVILDHHLPFVNDNKEIEYPKADVIIDPAAVPGSANFETYCAAGLVYKLAQNIDSLSENTVNKVLSLAAIGTVCDAVDLINIIGGHRSYDNYLIVKNGLNSLVQNNGRTTGLYCLLRMINKDCLISETDIAFVLGPIINAASRLNDNGAVNVVELLIKDDNKFNETDVIAQALIDNNEVRKKIEAEVKPVMHKKILAANEQNDFPIVVIGKPEEYHLGLLGILAGNVLETYNTPAIVLTPVTTQDNKVVYKGSARSPKGINIKKMLDKVSDDIITYGGHARAAGLTVGVDKIEDFKKHIKSLSAKPATCSRKYYDYEITCKEAASYAKLLKEKAPFGKGHEAPVFKITDFTVYTKISHYKYNIMGKNRNCIKIYGKELNAVNFSGEGLKKYIELNEPTGMALYGTLGENVYLGKTEVQMQFVDIDSSV